MRIVARVRLHLAAAAMAALALPAAAADHVETEALFHARAIQEAWDTLAQHITDGSSAAVSWTGTTPPASTGWQTGWTTRGLGALYCDNVLLVHAARASMKGVGTHLAAVQLAPHLEAKARNRDVPPLHWLEGGAATGVLGRASVTLPACMGTPPSDRPALAGTVVDPFTVTTNQVAHEHQDRACPSGFHGTGQTWTREVTQARNGRGDATGSPTTGPWSLLVDHCRADTTQWEYFRQACTFTPGAPHVGTLTGDAVWRRQKTVTAAGTAYGAPEFVSTTCWTDPDPAAPLPVETTSTTSESRSLGCGSGYSGSRTQRRTITWRHLKWPWDASATTQKVSTSNWATTSSSCRRITYGGRGCGRDGCSGGGGGRDGGGRGGGWDIDGDGKADIDHLGDYTGDRTSVNFVEGHTPVGGDRGDRGDPGGRTGAPSDGGARGH